MVYTIFTDDGEHEFEHLGELLEEATQSALEVVDRWDGTIIKVGHSWNNYIIHFEEGTVKRQFRLLDNGRDIYRARDGTPLDKIVPRFVLEPLAPQ